MSLLTDLHEDKSLFHREFQQKPQGRYVHFVLVRETESFPVFQTDGTLNVIRVQAGRGAEQGRSETISRLIMFKRKQSTPERLSGRELLHRYNIIADDENAENRCAYNSDAFCKRCPDCIIYGYAIGDAGAERSKVYVDSCFSITPYDESHKSFRFNALYEHGTMTEKGVTRSSFGEQDHIVPQVFFPAVVTLRDPTYEGFLYVLGNVLRTARYGAQETRTGRVGNHLVGLTFTNGEIFSNLLYTEAIYDVLANAEGELPALPLPRTTVLDAAAAQFSALLAAEPVTSYRHFVGSELDELRGEVEALYRSDERIRSILNSLATQTQNYQAAYGAPGKKGGKGKAAKGTE